MTSSRTILSEAEAKAAEIIKEAELEAGIILIEKSDVKAAKIITEAAKVKAAEIIKEAEVKAQVLNQINAFEKSIEQFKTDEELIKQFKAEEAKEVADNERLNREPLSPELKETVDKISVFLNTEFKKNDNPDLEYYCLKITIPFIASQALK